MRRNLRYDMNTRNVSGRGRSSFFQKEIGSGGGFVEVSGVRGAVDAVCVNMQIRWSWMMSYTQLGGAH